MGGGGERRRKSLSHFDHLVFRGRRISPKVSAPATDCVWCYPQAHGLDETTWGGALEAGALAKMKYVRIHIFDKVQGGFQIILEAVPDGMSDSSTGLASGRQVCLVWTGIHYETLVLRK